MKINKFISIMLTTGAVVLVGCGESSGDTDSNSGAGVGTATTMSTTGEDGGETMGGSSDGNPTTSGMTDPSTTGMSTGDFVPDGGGMSCGEECDIWNAMDCPDGEKCTAVACEVGGSAWDSNVCREIQGTNVVGDECMYIDGSGVSGNDSCELGSMCWNADADTGLGTCVAFCTGSADAPSCPAGTGCVIANNGVLPICLPGCDPLAQDCENADDLCLPDFTGDGYICVLNASGDMAPYGTPCNYANSCNHGLICIDPAGVPDVAECASASGCCSPMCSISAPNTCPASGMGQTCEPVFDPQPPGYEDIGVCTIAM